MSDLEFVEFPKIPRLTREIVITEKIDGTNACIAIGEDGSFRVGSRTKWITPDDDNHGFARWAYEHKDDLMQLGAGRHFGEWWGSGIQRRYGLNEKRFSLFNTHRWSESRPACCHVVPVLYRGLFDTTQVDYRLDDLRIGGSVAAPGFMQPEGVVVYHLAGNVGFKKTILKDEEYKGKKA